MLDGINDPGNAGTIVRTAEAVGAAGVVFARRQHRPLRSEDGAGRGRLARSAFRSSAPGRPGDAIAALRSAGFSCVGTVATDGDDHRVVDLTGDVGARARQ